MNRGLHEQAELDSLPKRHSSSISQRDAFFQIGRALDGTNSHGVYTRTARQVRWDRNESGIVAVPHHTLCFTQSLGLRVDHSASVLHLDAVDSSVP